MNIFEILGPVMVGPSSSHTAGAVRIGYISRKLMGEPVKQADIYLHGSFLATGKGHGTDRALIAGLLEMETDDIRIPDSFTIATKDNMSFQFHSITLRDVHPNSCMLKLVGQSGRNLEIIASSIGGGRIKIVKIDGLDANIGGDYPTLIVHNQDQPGHVTEVTSMLAHKGINIATMQLYRDIRGGNAVMVIECDSEIPQEGLNWIDHLEGINKVTYLSLKNQD
ncbi:L-serine dehydratase, beta subunit [Lachnospiraceae bacterium KM106-2]|nr:L-serine dehydratase, beta subunit [Lachnospiraceae bacterium KM106-2]